MKYLKTTLKIFPIILKWVQSQYVDNLISKTENYEHAFNVNCTYYVMQIQSSSKNQFFVKCCDHILCQPSVRFAGIISNMGRQIAGGYKEGITPLVDEEQHILCMEQALEISMSKDLDDSLGSIDHITSKRKNVIIISAPFDENLFLVSLEPDAKSEPIIDIISQFIENYSQFNS